MKAIASLATVMLLLAGVGLVACGDDDEDGTTEVKPFRTQVQALRRAANEWAPSFAAKGCTFEAQGPSPGHLPRGSEELCARLRPLLAAFQKSFADATVEDIKFKGVEAPPNRDPIPRSQRPPLYRAAVKFSNGEVVVFIGGGPPVRPGCAGACDWVLADPDQNRRFVQGGAPRE
jgi:hypothetical protein